MTYLGNSPGSSPSIVVSEYIATAGQTTFSASYYEYVQVYLNGMLLSASDYVANDGSTVVLAVGANAGDVVLINGYEVGLQGIKGDTGAQGLKGDKGDTGNVGPQGVKGDTGEVSLAELSAAIDGIDALPAQTGNSGKYLTTNGTDASWGVVDLSAKQDTLVSGTSIKTINGASVLGSGDMVLASGGSLDMQVFTTSGTWTKPAGVSMVRIMLVGGGGGGASGALTGSGATSCGQGGAGGGGGGTLDITVPASILNSTQSVSIGAGGLGGVGTSNVGDSSTGNTGQNGSAGGNTVFSSFTAYGGNYGKRGGPYPGSLVYTNIDVNNGGNSLDEVVTTNIENRIYKVNTSPTYGGNFLNRCSYFPYDASTNSYNVAMFSSIYGGCTTAGQCASNTAPYYFFYQQSSYGELCSSIYGGASGGHGGIVYLSAGTSGTKVADNSYTYTKNSPKKFLPSLISSSYTSVGGKGGSSSTTGAGTAGTNATGYGAGGGGGGSSLWGQTNPNGGNGSPGIAIIISW